MNADEPQSQQHASASKLASASDSADGGADDVPLVEVGQAPQAASPTPSTNDRGDNDGDTCCCPCFFICVVFALLLGFLFLIFGVLHLYFGIGDIGYRDVFIEFRIVYWLTMVLAALGGYLVSRRFPSDGPVNPSGFEYFVILSSIGPILQCILTIVANVQCSLVPTNLFLVEETFNMVQIFTQLLFYAHAKTVRQIGQNEHEEDDNSKRKRLVLMYTILCFAVCNLIMWVEDSFIETRNSMNSWQKYYFDNWPFVYNVFNPLSLVFRFNSALLFLTVLFDKKPASSNVTCCSLPARLGRIFFIRGQGRGVAGTDNETFVEKGNGETIAPGSPAD